MWGKAEQWTGLACEGTLQARLNASIVGESHREWFYAGDLWNHPGMLSLGACGLEGEAEAGRPASRETQQILRKSGTTGLELTDDEKRGVGEETEASVLGDRLGVMGWEKEPLRMVSRFLGNWVDGSHGRRVALPTCMGP